MVLARVSLGTEKESCEKPKRTVSKNRKIRGRLTHRVSLGDGGYG